MSLTSPMIMKPLKHWRQVLLALVANFILAPLLAYGIKSVLPLAQPVQTGLIVLMLIPLANVTPGPLPAPNG